MTKYKIKYNDGNTDFHTVSKTFTADTDLQALLKVLCWLNDGVDTDDIKKEWGNKLNDTISVIQDIFDVKLINYPGLKGELLKQAVVKDSIMDICIDTGITIDYLINLDTEDYLIGEDECDEVEGELVNAADYVEFLES